MTHLLKYILILLIIPTSPARATPPKQPKAAQYSGLWTHSPFTVKKISPPSKTTASPLKAEWSLGSISPDKGGYSVTLINKKKRKKRVRFISGYPSEGFKLIEVKQDASSPKLSTVLISNGQQQAWIGYDQKTITLKKGKVQKKRPARKNVARGKTSPPRLPRRPSRQKPSSK